MEPGHRTDEARGDIGAAAPASDATNAAAAASIPDWFETMVDTSPIGIGVISSLENRYVRANQALADVFGLSKAELLSADPYELAVRITHPEDIATEEKLFADLAVGERSSYRLEKRVVRPDGSVRWTSVTLSGIHFDAVDATTPVKSLRHTVVQVVDITELKTTQDLLQKSDAELRHAQRLDGIGRLAAGVAHDFNNLLTVIMGHGELLKGMIADGVEERALFEDSVSGILDACQRGASLTAQVLAHGRRDKHTPRSFVLSDVVADLQRMLARTLGSDVHTQHILAAQGSVFADRGQIGQVVLNLVLNARDAVSEGGHIAITTRDVIVDAPPASKRTPGPGAWVVLEVSDDGHGMSPEVKARIFEPFFTTRTDRAGTRGTGLGLATVQRIVAELGGIIEVDSAPGRGTTVRISLPRVESLAPKPALLHPQRSPARSGQSQRVLVIEDEPSVRSLIANVLLSAHYGVRVARDGREALRLLNEEASPFDLIVTDLVMPSVGGLELATTLQRRGAHQRILFISGYSEEAESTLASFGRLLSKPFSPADLLEAVHEALEHPVPIA